MLAGQSHLYLVARTRESGKGSVFQHLEFGLIKWIYRGYLGHTLNSDGECTKWMSCRSMAVSADMCRTSANTHHMGVWCHMHKKNPDNVTPLDQQHVDTILAVFQMS